MANQQGGSLLSRSHQYYVRSKKRQSRKETLRRPPQQQMNKRLDSNRNEKPSSNVQWAKTYISHPHFNISRILSFSKVKKKEKKNS